MEGSTETIHATATGKLTLPPLCTMQTSASSSLEYPSFEHQYAPHLSSRDLKIRNNHRRTVSALDTQGVGESRNSSLQKLWAEDYYETDDNEGGNIFEPGHKIHSIASSATVQPFTSSIEEAALPQRPVQAHQRSLTALLPFRNSLSRSPERKQNPSSPIREISLRDIEVDTFMPTLTGDKDGVIKVADRSKGGLASWFTGTSAPVPVGVPAITPEGTPNLSPSASMMSLREASPERGKLRKRPTIPIPSPSNVPFTTPTKPNTSASTSASIFGGFFSSPKTPSRPPNTIQIPASQAESDPFLGNLLSDLYPAGTESETFSPAAYKNLQMNAEGTILKLQTAYKIQLGALHEIAAERDAVREEKEESDLKAQCLQGKIDAMMLQDAERTKQISEQESLIHKLANELAVEKRARAEEKETREKSVALVKAQAEAQSKRQQHRINRSSTSNISVDTTSEDLGFASARRNRDSANSELSMSMESDMDIDSESVFSRCRSPTLTVNSTTAASSAMSMRSSLSTGQSTPELQQATFARVVPNPSLHPTANTPMFLPRPKSVQQKSTFQKLLSGMSSSEDTGTNEKGLYENIGMGVDGCSNCRGQDSSAAWDTVGLMRAENKGLKQRISELEEGVDSALDILRDPAYLGLV